MKSATGIGNTLTYIIAGVVLLYAAITIGFSDERKNHATPTKNNYTQLTELTGRTMGTTYTIKVAAVPSTEEDQLHDLIDEKLNHISGVMSTYDSSSEISMFNINGTTEWFPVSKELFSLLERAKKISFNTNRTFDITVGKLVNLWGFGADGEKRTTPPSRRKVKDVLRNSGIHLLRMKTIYKDEEEGKNTKVIPKAKGIIGKDNDFEDTDDAEKFYHIRRRIPELYIDLGGIAKGYAVDEVAALLSKQGYSTHMVEIGGEIKVSGSRLWRVAIESPIIQLENDITKTKLPNEEEVCEKDDAEDGICEVENSDAITKAKYTSHKQKNPEPQQELKNKKETRKIIKLTSGAIATSGDYRNFFTHKERTYSHTINPNTGYPVEHNLRSVTVTHPSCATADAIATALMIMGEKDGKIWANENSIQAIFYHQENNKIIITKSTAASSLIK
ncbi:MAG: FAD:protein FMN transferase [Alphaproteobacteria bacterium]|nr:FAD:protein FMN transferase [Alphaproteobacteria bacterium]